MAAHATITVYDGQPTPVAHAFAPESNDRDKGTYTAVWRESGLTALPIMAQPTLTATESVLRSGIKPATIKLRVPRMEVATGSNNDGYTAAPKIAFYDEIMVTYNRHPRATLQNSRDVHQMMANLLSGLSIAVTPVTGTAVADFLDVGLKPY